MLRSAQRVGHDAGEKEGGGRNLERYELSYALNPSIKIIQIQQLPVALQHLPHVYSPDPSIFHTRLPN